MSNPNDTSDTAAMGDHNNLGDEIQKSFKSLRKLMGMEPEEVMDEIIETENGNMEVSFATARPIVAFTSLRRLVDERTPFCMPSTNKKPKLSAIKTATRGVYDDSDREDDDHKDACSLLFADAGNVPSSPSLFRGGTHTPPISPILKTPDSDEKPSQVSRSILPELEETAAPSSKQEEPIQVETVDSDDEDGDDSQVEEQAPPATPTPHIMDKQTKPQRSIRTALCVYVAILTLLMGVFFGRLYQLNKLDHFVSQVKYGNMDSHQLKITMSEVTGTQDFDFNQHCADMGRKAKATYSAIQMQLQRGADKVVSQLQVWQLEIMERSKSFQDLLGTAWESVTVKNTVGDVHLERFHNKKAEVEIALMQLRSEVARYYDETSKAVRLKLETAMESEKTALLKQKWTEVLAAVVTYYEESDLRAYLQPSDIFAKEEVASDTCASAPVFDDETASHNEEAVDNDDVDSEGDKDIRDIQSDDEVHQMQEDIVMAEGSEEMIDAPSDVEGAQIEPEEVKIPLHADKVNGDDVVVTERVTMEVQEDIFVDGSNAASTASSSDESVEEAEFNDVVADEPSMTESIANEEEDTAVSDDDDVIEVAASQPQPEIDDEPFVNQYEETSPAHKEDGDQPQNDVIMAQMEPRDDVDTLDRTEEEIEKAKEEGAMVEEADNSNEETPIKTAKTTRKPLRKKIQNALRNIFGLKSDEEIQNEQELERIQVELDSILKNVSRRDRPWHSQQVPPSSPGSL
jgi:hypothetical protein